MKQPQEILMQDWPTIAAGYTALRLLRAKPEEHSQDPTLQERSVKLIALAMHVAGMPQMAIVDVEMELYMVEEKLCNLLKEMEEELG